MQPKERFKPFCAVFLMLIKGDQVLLQRRFNTGFRDGFYDFVAGHVDGNETIREATIREALEETGVEIKVDDLKFVQVMHRYSPQEGEAAREYIDFFFACTTWKGNSAIMEPTKADDQRWVKLDEIPEKTIPYIKEVIQNYKNHVHYSEFGWNK